MVPYFVSSGLNPGDPIYAGSTSASITQNLTRNYGGVTKTINLMTQETNWYDSTNRCYFNLSESDYWNRETGVLFEWAFTMVIWNATFSASLSKHYVMANCSLSGWTYNSTSANSNPTILGVEIQPELITKPQTLMIRVNATDTEDRQNITATCAITLPNGTTSTLTATLANSTI